MTEQQVVSGFVPFSLSDVLQIDRWARERNRYVPDLFPRFRWSKEMDDLHDAKGLRAACIGLDGYNGLTT